MGRRKTGDVPALKRHGSGAFYVRSEGRHIWFGSDPSVAQGRYGSWLSQRAVGTPTAPAPQPAPTINQTAATGPTVRKTAERLFALVDSECGQHERQNIRNHLKTFVERFGSRVVGTLTADELLAYRSDLARGRMPESINHSLRRAKRLLRLADFRFDSASLQAMKTVKGGVRKPKAWSVPKVRLIVEKLCPVNPNLARTLLLAFYCVLRPSEIARVVAGEGEWVSPNVFELAESKTAKRTGQARAVCFSPEALALLKRVEPRSPNFEALRLACKRSKKWVGFAFTPHPLRHSAASALIEAGVDVSLVRTALGRGVGQVDGIYFKPPYAKTCEALSALAKLVPEPTAKPINSVKLGIERRKAALRKAA